MSIWYTVLTMRASVCRQGLEDLRGALIALVPQCWSCLVCVVDELIGHVAQNEPVC